MTPTRPPIRSATPFPSFPPADALQPRPSVRALFDAILEQDEQQVLDLLARRAPVNGIGPGGRLPIFAALQTSQLRLATLLVEAGADVMAQDERGRTPLTLAIQVADESPAAEWLLHRLLAKRSSLSQRDHQGRTPLLNAALAGNAMAFGLLLDAGASVFDRDQHEASALLLALIAGRLGGRSMRALVERALIAGRATPAALARLLEPDATHGISPLGLAALTDDAESCALLLEAGAIDDRPEPGNARQNAFAGRTPRQLAGPAATATFKAFDQAQALERERAIEALAEADLARLFQRMGVPHAV